MPFTIAHPAILLPLRHWLPWSALAIGAITPDLEYLLKLRPLAGLGHSFVGLVLFCLPVGLALWLLFHRLIKRAAELMLPESERCYTSAIAENPTRLSFTALAQVTFAILLGAASHWAWDSLTHAGRIGDRIVPNLKEPILTLSGYDVTLLRLFQHGSTVVGTAVLILAYARWRSRQKPSTPQERLVPTVKIALVAVQLFAPIALAILVTLPSVGLVDDLESIRPLVGLLVVRGLAFATVTGLLISVFLANWRDQLTVV